MKKNLQMIISASAASLLAFAAVAQDTPIPKTDRPDYNRERAPNPSRTNSLNGAAKASDLIGMTVKNYQDEKIGKVEDLAVDVESGRIVQVILATGGFIGIGNTLTAVPPGALHHDVAQKVLHLDANKEKLKGAPKYDTANWDEATQSNRVTEVYTYYGEPSYFNAAQKVYVTSDADLSLVKSLPRNQDGTVNTDANRSAEKARNVEAARNVARTHNTRATRNPDGTWTREYYLKTNGTNASGSSPSQVQKATKLVGTPVKNLQDEKLGDVDDMLVDLPAGRIVAVIVSSGGFLGMDDELSAVPPTALQFTTEPNTLRLDTSKEMLSNAPHFNADQWPDFSQPSYASGVYRAYNVEPYFTTNSVAGTEGTERKIRDRDDRNGATTEPDNTGRNVRDRNNQTLTPPDQGNSKADVDTTAEIRKGITADKNMSVTAQNVKIITQNGKVTLRGPVKTNEEKRLIGEIANRIATSGNVDNQLEVKPTTNTNTDK